eukprot:4512518-Amphidinium_carterae.1
MECIALKLHQKVSVAQGKTHAMTSKAEDQILASHFLSMFGEGVKCPPRGPPSALSRNEVSELSS